MQILYQGAESIVYLGTFEDQESVVKERIKKGYRIRELDEELRKLRTRKEVKLLTEVRKLGIATPRIFHVDEKEHKIIMENVRGDRLKEYLNTLTLEKAAVIYFQLGTQIGKLHSHDIVHGDLTTSNMILKGDNIYFIDPSLGEFTRRIEDKAVDMKLLKEAIKSTHFKIFDTAWENILKGYVEECRNAADVLKQLKEIEKRARYANREVPL